MENGRVERENKQKTQTRCIAKFLGAKNRKTRLLKIKSSQNSKTQTPDMAKIAINQEKQEKLKSRAPKRFPNEKLQDASIENKSKENPKNQSPDMATRRVERRRTNKNKSMH